MILCIIQKCCKKHNISCFGIFISDAHLRNTKKYLHWIDKLKLSNVDRVWNCWICFCKRYIIVILSFDNQHAIRIIYDQKTFWMAFAKILFITCCPRISILLKLNGHIFIVLLTLIWLKWKVHSVYL